MHVGANLPLDAGNFLNRCMCVCVLRVRMCACACMPACGKSATVAGSAEATEFTSSSDTMTDEDKEASIKNGRGLFSDGPLWARAR